MSQEITIIVLIDIQAALDANTLDGNIYLIDNLRTDGSTGVGTGDLTTIINGSYWCNGAQATEVITNWLTTGIGSLPLTLPRDFYIKRTAEINNELLNDIKTSAATVLTKIESGTFINDLNGHKRALGIKPLTVTGDYFDSHTDDPSSLSYLTPIITNISGEAVDKGVLYTCQLGTPVYIKDGWYWCATADTSKVGIYSYTLHVTLFKPVNNTYEPVQMTYDAKIKVTSNPQVNGFTKAGMGILPL